MGKIDQFAELMSAVARALPRDMDSTMQQGWITNPVALEKVLRGALMPTEEQLVPKSPPARSSLVGKVVKTITIPAYDAPSFAEAVRQGNFDNDTTEIIRQFAKEQVGLTKPTKVDLVQFDREWWMTEVLVWGKEHGNKKPIETSHTMGIAIGLPDEQHNSPIVELGSVQHGYVLYLHGHSDWRFLLRHTAKDYWSRNYLVGFLSE